MADAKKAVVLFDSVRYMDGETPTRALKGQEVSLSADEFKRLEDLGAVASPRSKDAKEAIAESEELPGE